MAWPRLRLVQLASAALIGFGWHGGAAAAPLPLGPMGEPAPTISLLTFGPGDAAFLKFGHNAVRVQDPGPGTDLVYNFGTFRFDNPWLIWDFLAGKFQYWLSVSTFADTTHHYRVDNRDIVEQVLNLAPTVAHKLANALVDNAKPEHRFYLYDYYRDNCSTRIRDAIEGVLGGSLKPRFEEPASMSLRDHTLRLTADDFWLYLGLDIAMGSFIDQPETRWSEMFLPDRLESGLAGLTFTDYHGAHRFVKERRVWYTAEGRPPLRRVPPQRTMGFLQAGTAIGALLAFLGWEVHRRRQRWAQVLACSLIGALGLATGVLGTLFWSLWLFTNHLVAHRNENILQCAPWAVVVAVCTWGMIRGNPRQMEVAYRAVQAALVSSALGLLLKVVPSMEQHNERVIALLLPIWCGAFCALHLMRLRGLKAVRVVERTSDADPEEDAPEEPEPTPPPEKERGKASVPPNSQPAPA